MKSPGSLLDGGGWRGPRWAASQASYVATFSHRFMIQRVKTRHTRRAPTSGNEVPVGVHVVKAACRKSVASDRIRAAALAMIGKKRVPPRAALSSARTALAARLLAVRSRLLFGSMPNRPHRVGLAGGGGGGRRAKDAPKPSSKAAPAGESTESSSVRS